MKFRFRDRLVYNIITRFPVPSIDLISGRYYGGKYGKIVRDPI